MADERVPPAGGADPRQQASTPCPVYDCHNRLVYGRPVRAHTRRCLRCHRFVVGDGGPAAPSGGDVSGPGKGVRPLGPFTRGEG